MIYFTFILGGQQPQHGLVELLDSRVESGQLFNGLRPRVELNLLNYNHQLVANAEDVSKAQGVDVDDFPDGGEEMLHPLLVQTGHS